MNNYDLETQQKAGFLTLGFLMFLCLLFVAAKLFGFIAWSWWWVFCPVWAPFALGLLLLLLGIRPPQ